MKIHKWLTALAITLLVLICSFACAEMKLDKTSFPDELFRNYLARYDTDGNKVLSDEDIDDLEKQLTEFLLKPQLEEIEKKKATLEKDEDKAALDDYVKKLRAQAMLKMILPCRYHDKAGNPFPNELT